MPDYTDPRYANDPDVVIGTRQGRELGAQLERQMQAAAAQRENTGSRREQMGTANQFGVGSQGGNDNSSQNLYGRGFALNPFVMPPQQASPAPQQQAPAPQPKVQQQAPIPDRQQPSVPQPIIPDENGRPLEPLPGSPAPNFRWNGNGGTSTAPEPIPERDMEYYRRAPGVDIPGYSPKGSPAWQQPAAPNGGVTPRMPNPEGGNGFGYPTNPRQQGVSPFGARQQAESLPHSGTTPEEFDKVRFRRAQNGLVEPIPEQDMARYRRIIGPTTSKFPEASASPMSGDFRGAVRINPDQRGAVHRESAEPENRGASRHRRNPVASNRSKHTERKQAPARNVEPLAIPEGAEAVIPNKSGGYTGRNGKFYPSSTPHADVTTATAKNPMNMDYILRWNREHGNADGASSLAREYAAQNRGSRASQSSENRTGAGASVATTGGSRAGEPQRRTRGPVDVAGNRPSILEPPVRNE